MNTFASKAGWIVAALASVTLIASWAGAINAGPLDPPGEPAPTMKSLDEIPGSWSRVLSSTGADACATERFDCVLFDGAVLDRETGLVWVRDPDTDTMPWSSAFQECGSENHAGRMGFRLPSISELASLADVFQPAGLPADHPFTIGTEDYFWSSTQDATSATGRAMKFDFSDLGATSELKEQAFRTWCVRGPGGADVQ